MEKHSGVLTYHVQEGFASDKLLGRSCSSMLVWYISNDPSAGFVNPSIYPIKNEGVNLISAMCSDSPREAVSEVGVLQFASKGEVIPSCTLAALQAVT